MEVEKDSAKHKDIVAILSKRHTVGFIDVFSSLEIQVSSTVVDNIVTTLKSDAVVKLWPRSANIVATLQSCNFIKCLATSFRHVVDVASANILVFLGKLLYAGNRHLTV